MTNTTATVEEQLKNCEYYFLAWLGSDTHTPKEVREMTLALYEYLTLPEDLETYEPDSMVALQELAAPLVETFMLVHIGELDLANETIKREDVFIKHCEDKEFVPSDYIPGYKFLSFLLKMHIDNAVRIKSGAGLEECEEEVILPTFFDLSAKSKAVVMLTKFQFMEQRGRKTSGMGVQQLQEFTRVLKTFFADNGGSGSKIYTREKWDIPRECLLIFAEVVVANLESALRSLKAETTKNENPLIQHAINLDPENWSWNYLMCSRARFNRKQGEGSLSTKNYPCKQEIDAIIKAVKYAPEGVYHAMAIGGYCQCLAEILKYRTHHRNTEPLLCFGETEFENNDQIIAYILKEARHALENDRISFAEAIRYGEILSHMLPSEYRDLGTSKKCFEIALKIMPQNSKANHRMGLFYVQTNDITKAVNYLQEAVSCSSNNFPASIDLIQALMSSFEEHEDQIKDLCTTYIGNPKCSPGNLPCYSFLLGCFYFMKQIDDTAIIYWIQYKQTTANAGVQPYTNFKMLRGAQARFKWPENRLTLKNIQAALLNQHKETDEYSAHEEEALMQLLFEVEEALKIVTRVRGSQHQTQINRTTEPREQSLADQDDSWRTSKATDMKPTSDREYNGGRFESGSFQRPRFQRDGGVRSYQTKSDRFKKRSPSPPSWR